MKMKISAVICAAGKGERAGFGKNKLLAPLFGEPALFHTLKKFAIPEIDEAIVTSSVCDFEEISALCAPFGFKVVIGGDTRTESVKRALEEVTGDIVLIHDGARPYLSKQLIKACINGVKSNRSAVCAVRATDTAIYGDTRLDRNLLYLVQTPQGFYTEDIKKAYSLAGEKTYTDDSAVYAEFIGRPHIVDGESGNIKLTFKEDFMRGFPPLPSEDGKLTGFGTTRSVAAKRINISDNNVYAKDKAFTEILCGFGVDVHAFGEGSFVTLCGVKIDCDRGLIAHSDGDVAIHAVMDSLLSAAGLKDIGHYFPDTDPAYKNADSGKMLKSVIELLKQSGFAPVNLSVSIQAEKPRLAKHIEQMKANLSKLTGVAEDRIAIAAGTCEGLGFVGEGLGICAYCISTLTNF